MEYFRIILCGILLTSAVLTFIISIFSLTQNGRGYEYFFGSSIDNAI